MAAKTPDVGTGATIGFSTSFFATATSFSWSGVSREALDTTTLATTAAKTYMPGDLYDPGELSVEMQWDTDLAVGTPFSATTAEAVTITWPDAETAVANGFLTSFEINTETESVMTATGTIKFTGAITW